MSRFGQVDILVNNAGRNKRIQFDIFTKEDWAGIIDLNINALSICCREFRCEMLTDIQRAARFYYLQQTCFGGRIDNPTFGYGTTGGPRLNLLRIEEELSAAHLRLSRGLCRMPTLCGCDHSI